MATTKKSIKTTGKKKGGKRYMKKAARRTLAALLMITALIVAAIPATPGAARAPSNANAIRNNTTEVLRYNSLDGSTRYYFKRITNVGININDIINNSIFFFIVSLYLILNLIIK